MWFRCVTGWAGWLGVLKAFSWRLTLLWRLLPQETLSDRGTHVSVRTTTQFEADNMDSEKGYSRCVYDALGWYHVSTVSFLIMSYLPCDSAMTSHHDVHEKWRLNMCLFRSWCRIVSPWWSLSSGELDPGRNKSNREHCLSHTPPGFNTWNTLYTHLNTHLNTHTTGRWWCAGGEACLPVSQTLRHTHTHTHKHLGLSIYLVPDKEFRVPLGFL